MREEGNKTPTAQNKVILKLLIIPEAMAAFLLCVSVSYSLIRKQVEASSTLLQTPLLLCNPWLFLPGTLKRCTMQTREKQSPKLVPVWDRKVAWLQSTPTVFNKLLWLLQLYLATGTTSGSQISPVRIIQMMPSEWKRNRKKSPSEEMGGESKGQNGDQ